MLKFYVYYALLCIRLGDDKRWTPDMDPEMDPKKDPYMVLKMDSLKMAGNAFWVITQMHR